MTNELKDALYCHDATCAGVGSQVCVFVGHTYGQQYSQPYQLCMMLTSADGRPELARHVYCGAIQAGGEQWLQACTAQYSTVQYSTVQYSTVQYSTVQYSTVQNSTVIGPAKPSKPTRESQRLVR
jgi:hypothetical protein